MMKPLETHQSVLTKLSMCPSDENESRRDKVIRILSNSMIFVIFVSFMISSAIFIWKSVDLEEKLFVLFQLCGGSVVIYPFMVTILLRRKIAALFEKFTAFFDEYKDDASFRFLHLVNNKCEWFWGIYFKYGIFGFTSVMILNYIGSIVWTFYFDEKLNTEHSFRAYKLILPWDQQTPIGYTTDMIFSLSIAQIYSIVHGAIILFFISLCLYHRAFYKMFRHSTHKLEMSDVKSDHRGYILKLLHLHIAAKDVFMESAEVYSHIIAVELIASMIGLASAVFQIDLKLGRNDFNISFLLLIPVSASISNLFLYCYLGKMATECFQRMSDCLYECNWHELPVDLQKSFVLMIQNAQKSIHYHGFGVVHLNLETFCDLLRAVYSYYMIFKTLTSD